MVDIYFLYRCRIFDWRLYEHTGGNISMKDLTMIERIVIISGIIVLVYIVGGHYE